MIPAATPLDQVEVTTDVGIQAIEAIAQAMHALALSLNGAFDGAVRAIAENTGYLVISGVGNFGLVGRKMATALSRAGIPGFFVSPEDLLDEGLGAIQPDGLVILISNSGESSEIMGLLTSLRRMNNKIIALVGKEDSTLGLEADIVLALPIQSKENFSSLKPALAPVLAMALGDALAAAVTRLRQFPCETLGLEDIEEAPNQPPESMTVQDVMQKRSGKNFPIIAPTANMQETIRSITQGRLELVLVMEDELLIGLITTDDLNRAIMNASFSMTESTAADIMRWNPATIYEDAPLSQAEQTMMEAKTKALAVLDKEQRVSGVVESLQP